MAVKWISVKMLYHWQISWEVQKTKWSICKRIGFSPLHSIVQPVILFLSEWTGKGVSTSSTSDALISISKGVLGRGFCSWWKFFQIIFVLALMSQLQNWNSSFWQEERDAHICPNCIFLCGLFSHPSATHPWSVLDACRWLFQDKEREKYLLSHHSIVPRDIQVSFFYFWSFFSIN